MSQMGPTLPSRDFRGMRSSSALAKEIEGTTRSEIRLKNGIAIAVHPNSFRFAISASSSPARRSARILISVACVISVVSLAWRAYSCIATALSRMFFTSSRGVTVPLPTPPRTSLRYCFGKEPPKMDLSQAPAFVAAKMAMLSDACAAAATRADELTGQISHVRDRLNGRVVREGDHPAELRIELDRLLAEQKALQARRPIEMGIIESCKAWLAALPPGTVLEQVTPDVEDGLSLSPCGRGSRNCKSP